MLDVLQIGEVSLRYVNCTGPHTAQRYVQRALWYRGYLPGRTNFLTTVASYKVDMDLYLFLHLTFLQCQPWNTSVVKKAITIWTRRPDCWRIILTRTKQGYLHVRIIPLGNNLTMTYLKKNYDNISFETKGISQWILRASPIRAFPEFCHLWWAIWDNICQEELCN